MPSCRVTLPRFGRPRTWPPVATAVAVVVVATLSRCVRRVEVAGRSMAPGLEPGDRLVVLRRPGRRQPWPAVGSVVAVRDPRVADRILVKRVGSVDRQAGVLEVVGDAREASTDSRTFGPLPRSAIVGRAVYRYAPTARSGPGPWTGEYDRM